VNVSSLDINSAIDAMDTIVLLCTPDGDAPKAPKGYKIITKDSIYRSLLVTNSGIFTLMSFLGVKNESSSASDDSDDIPKPSINQKKLATTTTSKNDNGPARQILLKTIETLHLLCKQSQELRDKFLAQQLVVKLLEEPTWVNDPDVSAALLALIKISSKQTESNKGYFVTNGGLPVLMGAISANPSNAKVLGEVCMVVGVLCKFDDYRKEMSGAHDNAKEVSNLGFIPALHKIALLSHQLENLQLAVAVMNATRVLSVNDEIVQTVVASGLLDWTRNSIEKYLDSPGLVSAAIGVYRNISGNDEIKSHLCTNGSLDQMLAGMKRHLGSASVQEHGCGTIAAMALRRPENVEIIIGKGGAVSVATAMKQHPKVVPLQRQGCLAVRNMIVRNQDLKENILECGFEPILKAAGQFQGSVDEAYAALRDLGCEGVGMKKFDEDGKEIKLQMFGEKKANFNATVDETKDIENRVNVNAKAPALSNPELF